MTRLRNILSATAIGLVATVLLTAVVIQPAVHPGYKTYSATTANFTPAATPTDLCVLTGHASNTVKVLDARIGGTATASTVVDIFLVRRSTADTLGTFVAATVVPHDVVDTSVGPVLGHYTANPTLGSLVGNLTHRKVTFPIGATAVSNVNEPLLPTLFPSAASKPIVLRGPAAQLAINFNGAALPAGAANWFCTFTWIEETPPA